MWYIEINGRRIGPNEPVYIVAEMSANHNQKFDEAVNILRSAKEAGANAVKLQTYTPDTLTINCKNEYFKIEKGTIWEGSNLYDLYSEAFTPWEWQPKLKRIANDLGLDLFSAPFDKTAVDFLTDMNVPAYKIASFEIVDLPFIEYVAKTGKPIILSTGMASLSEIEEAVTTLREAGALEIALLKCTSAYPAQADEMNLKTIPHLSEAFQVPVGLSDHTVSIAVPVAATTIGACIIEKHFTLSRSVSGPDNAFSLEPHEFKSMVDSIRIAEKAIGKVHYGTSDEERKSKIFRRSLFVVEDIKTGETFTKNNVRSIRPGNGLPPKFINDILGRRATRDIERGVPLDWEMIV
jgi:pseudaminic acid synthase